MRTTILPAATGLFRLLLALFLLGALLPACRNDDFATPSSSSSSSGFDDHGGHGSDDPPGDDHGSGHN